MPWGQIRRSVSCLITLSVSLTAFGQTVGSPVIIASSDAQQDVALGIAAASNGFYVAGTTRGNLDPGTLCGAANGFLQHRDASGSLVFSQQFACNTESGRAVAANATHIYLANVRRTGVGSSTDDAYVTRYGLAGTDEQSYAVATSARDSVNAIAVDGTGVTIAGSTQGAFASFSNAGLDDAFVARLDLTGNLLWVRQFGGSGGDVAYGVASNGTTIYVVGEMNFGPTAKGFVRSVDVATGAMGSLLEFGPTTGAASFRSAALSGTSLFIAGYTNGVLGTLAPVPATSLAEDAIIARFTTTGTTLDWVRQYQPTTSLSNERFNAIAVGPSGIYAAGFRDNSGSTTNESDLYAAKVDAAGTELWSVTSDLAPDEVVNALVAGSNGVTVAGFVQSTLFATNTQDAFYLTIAESVTPPTPAEMIEALIGAVNELNAKNGIINSLDAKLQQVSAALAAAESNDRPAACNKLSAFINEVNAQTGKAIAAADAATLLTSANNIMAALGCTL